MSLFCMGLGASLAVMTLLSLPMDPFHRRMFGFGVLAMFLGALPLLWREGMLNLLVGLVTGSVLELGASTVHDFRRRQLPVRREGGEQGHS